MAKKDLTEREMYIMARAWESCDEAPKVHARRPLLPPVAITNTNDCKVNYKKLMDKCGMTNPGSAANAWRAIQKKLEAMKEADNSDTGADGATTTASPGASTETPKKRGRKKAAAEGDGIEDESPAKKAKRRKGKATVKAEPLEDDGHAGTVDGEAADGEAEDHFG